MKAIELFTEVVFESGFRTEFPLDFQFSKSYGDTAYVPAFLNEEEVNNEAEKLILAASEDKEFQKRNSDKEIELTIRGKNIIVDMSDEQVFVMPKQNGLYGLAVLDPSRVRFKQSS